MRGWEGELVQDHVKWWALVDTELLPVLNFQVLLQEKESFIKRKLDLFLIFLKSVVFR